MNFQCIYISFIKGKLLIITVFLFGLFKVNGQKNLQQPQKQNNPIKERQAWLQHQIDSLHHLNYTQYQDFTDKTRQLRKELHTKDSLYRILKEQTPARKITSQKEEINI